MSNEKTERKKILMLCYYLPPFPRVGGLRSSKFIKYLPSLGWHIDVITAYKARHLQSDRVKVHYVISVNLRTLLQTVRNWFMKGYNRLKSWRKSNKVNNIEADTPNISNRPPVHGIVTKILRYLLLPDPQFLWIFLALPVGILIARKVDVIYSSALPWSAHVLGLILSKISGKPLVLDYRDEWTLNMNWYPPTKFHRWLGDKLDKACIRRASYVINVSEARTELFKRHFNDQPAEKFVTIHNGFDEDEIALFTKIHPPDKPLTITSIGSLYGGRNPNGLLNVLEELLHKNDIDNINILVKFIGDCSLDVTRRIESGRLKEIVHLIGRVSQREAIESVARSHVALLVGGRMEKVAMTTKIYEYIGLYKPVFALVPDGQLKDFVLEYGGWVAEPDNTEQIKKALTDIFAAYKANGLDKKVNREMVTRYTRYNLTRELDFILRRITNS